MWFLICGLLMIFLKLMGWSPIAQWGWDTHWWAFCTPFALTIVWWYIADTTGYTLRKAMENDQKKREARRQIIRDQLKDSVRKKT